VSEQRPDPVAPAAGWYTDPEDATRSRWWNGTVWTNRFAPTGGPPARTEAVGPGRRWGTVWVWLLAFSPWLTTTTGFFVLNAGGPSDTNPWDQVLLGALPLVLIVFVAALDMRQLRRWHDPVAHWAWAVLGGPIYIIARTVVLRRHGRFGSAPLWVALANMVAALIPFLPLAGLYFFVIVMGFFSTLPHA
jgi:hypothetical protein